MDRKKIYDFLIKGSKLIGALAVFLALFVGAVKYANKDFENRVERELDTIKNNHIFHINADIEKLSVEIKETRKELKEDIKEIKEEHKELKKEINDLRNDMNKQGNDISYIKGLLEKQFGIKK
jgi:septal ring factor EnvC (AmiA/AmiB activator)